MTAMNIQDRIGQLEKLVTTLMSAKGPVENVQSKDPLQLAEDFGRISLENTEISYVEGAHWSAIMDSVSSCLLGCSCTNT